MDEGRKKHNERREGSFEAEPARSVLSKNGPGRIVNVLMPDLRTIVVLRAKSMTITKETIKSGSRSHFMGVD